MNQILKAGQKVKGETSGAACEVGDFLGGGGQGEVYKATMGGRPLALKWYFPPSATPEQRQALELLVAKGPPNDKFLWPIELTSQKGVPAYGYVMPLRDRRYQGIVDVFFRRVEPSLRALVTCCLNLASTFMELHAKGLCYRDISHGNVFFDPRDGEVMICDCDNVGVTGSSYTGVTGTSGYSAPEIERGEALPSTQTDLHSLAVLMFKILMMHHPLEGTRETAIKCFDVPARQKLYGGDPLFIFDPVDASNKPDIRYHQAVLNHWPIYPQIVRDLFTKAFTDGLKDPTNGRVRESEWRSAMVRVRDAIFYCGCGAENFYDAEALKATEGKPLPCWACQKAPTLPARIRIGRNVIMLNHDTKLYPHHLLDKHYDFTTPLAEMSRHPKDPNVWGIKNLGKDKWVVTMPDGSTKDVEAGRSFPLTVGLKVKFGPTEGEIRL